MSSPTVRPPLAAPSFSLSLEIPHGAIAVVLPRPAFVSQRTSHDVLGIPPDRFLTMLRAPGFPVRVVSSGKLRLVETEALIAYLRERGTSPGLLDIAAHDGESGAALASEPSAESEEDAARKLGDTIGFRFHDPPPSDAPRSRRRGRR